MNLGVLRAHGLQIFSHLIDDRDGKADVDVDLSMLACRHMLPFMIEGHHKHFAWRGRLCALRFY